MTEQIQRETTDAVEEAAQPGRPPDPEHLEQVQERIVEQLDIGAPEAAVEHLEVLRPPDRAEILAELDTSKEQVLLGSLSEEAIAEVLEHMEVDEAVELTGLVDVGRMAAVLDRTPPDVAADVLRGIDWVHAGQILARMQASKAVADLLTYEDDDAGGLMSPDVVALRDTWPAAYAVTMLRSSGLQPGAMRQLFVVDRDRKLVGQLELPELVFAKPGARVQDVMDTDVISVETGTDQEEVARLMSRYEIRSVPVVDHEGRLEGAIAVEDLVDVVEREATEDMFRMAGVRGEDRATGPVRVSVRNRLPWLLANIVTVAFVASVLSLFEPTLEAVAILAVYMPMVMNQAGVAGTQVVTVIVRSMALDQVSPDDLPRLLWREAVIAAVNGTVVSVVLGLIVGLWQWDLEMGLIVFGAMLISYFVAGAVGVLIPMTMKRLRIDPATASGAVLTAFTDLAGGATYLGLATLFLTTLR